MNNDVQAMQVQVENTSNRLDTALHKLAEYQRVVAGAVKDGVYRNDNYWWHELKRLANEQAVEHGVHVDVAPCGHTEDQMELMLEDGKFYCKVCGALRQ